MPINKEMIDWKKDIKESAIDGALMTTGLYAFSMIGAKIGLGKPTLSINAENLGKFFIYAALTDALIAYAKDQKWIPST